MVKFPKSEVFRQIDETMRGNWIYNMFKKLDPKRKPMEEDVYTNDIEIE